MLEPNPVAGIERRLQTLDELKSGMTRHMTSLKTTVEDRATSLFDGFKDSHNLTILDYLRGGSFAEFSRLPKQTVVEQFFTQQAIARAVDKGWKTTKTVVLRMEVADPKWSNCPVETAWYDADEKAEYCAFLVKDDGGLMMVPHLDVLDQNGIHGSDISKASARSYRMGKFAFTQRMAVDNAVQAMMNNSTLAEFTDGAGSVGEAKSPRISY